MRVTVRLVFRMWTRQKRSLAFQLRICTSLKKHPRSSKHTRLNLRKTTILGRQTMLRGRRPIPTRPSCFRTASTRKCQLLRRCSQLCQSFQQEKLMPREVLAQQRYRGLRRPARCMSLDQQISTAPTRTTSQAVVTSATLTCQQEDGPTHQPVETVSGLRVMPNLDVIRPCDGEETAGA